MGNVLISSEKSPSLLEKVRKKPLLARSSTASTSTQEIYAVQNLYSTISQEQLNVIGSNGEDEGKTQWSFEQRTATLRDTRRVTNEFLTACAQLKASVSTKVDDLLNDLPDAHDPHFETKYKTILQQLRELISVKRNTSKQQTKKKK